MIRIRGGSGLGDAMYVRAVAEYLVSQGHKVEACSNYVDVFAGANVLVTPFRRQRIDRLAHYSTRKGSVGTNQWQDVCDTAGIPRMPLHMDWTVRNAGLVQEVREAAGGKPIVLVHGGRSPMARTDGFGKELLPKVEAFCEVLGELADCFLVQIGRADQIYDLPCDLNLNGATSITDLFDLALSCEAVVGQCSFVIPLAEVFDKPLLIVWAARGMKADMHPYIKQITPQKVLSKSTSMHVVDDWNAERMREAVHAFRDAFRTR